MSSMPPILQSVPPVRWAPAAALRARLSPVRALLPGLLLTGALAAAAMGFAQLGWLDRHGISALTLAIVLGMVVGNTRLGQAIEPARAGVDFSRQRLLRLGIVLYGIRLTVQDMAHVGLEAVLVDALMLSSTFALALLAGVRLLRIDRDTAILIGAGSSICGAAAVMATQPVLRARAQQVAVAVATVVVFGTAGLFLYPLIYDALASLPALAMSPQQYGVFAGSTIHEVAQVVAAGRAISAQAADTAVVAKMGRVMMLAPFLLMLSAWLARGSRKGQAASAALGSGVAVPWFALGFVAVMLFHSAVALPPSWVAFVNAFDTGVLAMAMAGLGLTTHASAIRRAGVRPLAMASLLFVWLVVGGFAVNRWLMGTLG
ncbi:hypothetical protein E5CHR_04508 [Variovorax sp. PBL-E5]|nr:hypothetical protein E5CHR_04508 [Variovorax sp. PBL-E5]